MKVGVGNFDLEPLEPRLLLSATPLFPQALMAVPPSESLVAVQGYEMGQQVTHANDHSPSYDPANHVSGLFAGAEPVAVTPAASSSTPHDGSVSLGSHNGPEGSGTPAALSLAEEPIAPQSASPNAAAQLDASLTSNQSPAGHSAGSATRGSTAAGASRSENATTNTIVKTLNAAQPPPGSGIFSYTAGPHGSDLTLTLDAHNQSQLDLVNNSTGKVVASAPLDQVKRAVVTGANYGNDTLTVDMTHPFWLSGGVSFSGGAGPFDTLAVTASAGGSVAYTALGGGSGTAGVTDGGHSTLILNTGASDAAITVVRSASETQSGQEAGG